MADDQNKNPNESDDNFGLPDIEYKPIDRAEDAPAATDGGWESTEPEKPKEPVRETPKYSYTAPEEPSSKAPLIIGLIIGVIVVLAGFLIYFYVIKPDQERKEKARIEAAEKKKRDEEAARLAREQEEAERARKAAEEAEKNKIPPVGTIETLSARTQRYYVVVASAVDGDLIMDRAKKMSASGVSSKIIPPFGKWKFYRLAIADFDTFANAQAHADSKKAELGSGLWVIRY
ncbi:MAG: hypothetical protein ACK5DD_14145 [Cyclobacteriaceae bacterium]|jgi:hypothetical protein